MKARYIFRGVADELIDLNYFECSNCGNLSSGDFKICYKCGAEMENPYERNERAKKIIKELENE